MPSVLGVCLFVIGVLWSSFVSSAGPLKRAGTVQDGDTIDIFRGGNREKLRLNGIDAPEKVTTASGPIGLLRPC